MTVRIITAHVIDGLRQLADQSVHCVVTSPPYYGLRSYGTEPQVWGGDPNCQHVWQTERVMAETSANVRWQHTTGGGGDGTMNRFAKAGEEADAHREFQAVERGLCHCGAWRGDLGLEPTPELYIQHLVEVFAEVKRVLRKDGTLWLNIGDSYAGGGGFSAGAPSSEFSKSGKYGSLGALKSGGIKPSGVVKAKDLLMIPAQLALALRADGWWLRSEIVWAKRAPMPESVTDRPTSAHEKVFLLTKSARCFYDAEAVKEEAECDRVRGPADYQQVPGGGDNSGLARRDSGGKRNMRNVWHLGPEPFPEAHFATFPTEVPRRAILAGTSAKGVCASCGAGWMREIKTEYRHHEKWFGDKQGARHSRGKAGVGYSEPISTQTIGWRPSCSCNAGEPRPATVLEPFLGSGTTALVADQLGRDCIGIELAPSYAAMSERRVRDDAGMFAQIAAE